MAMLDFASQDDVCGGDTEWPSAVGIKDVNIGAVIESAMSRHHFDRSHFRCFRRGQFQAVASISFLSTAASGIFRLSADCDARWSGYFLGVELKEVMRDGSSRAALDAADFSFLSHFTRRCADGAGLTLLATQYAVDTPLGDAGVKSGRMRGRLSRRTPRHLPSH